MSEEVSAAISESIAGLEGSDGAPDLTTAADPDIPPAASASPMPGVPPTPSSTAPAAPGPTIPATPAAKVVPDGDAQAGTDRKGRFIPLDRHEATLQTARQEHQAEIVKLREQTDTMLAEARQQAQLLQLAETDPDRFLDALAQADPRYAQRIAGRNGNGNGNGPVAANGHTQHPGGAMPGPDAQLPDGSVGYSPEGLKALLDWHAGRVQSQMEQRYAPVLQDHEARAAYQAAEGRVRQKVTAALAWPGFAEAQPEIAAALRADRTLDLHGAYMRVVVPKLQANRDTMRAEILAEIQGKPLKVSGTTPHGNPPPVASSDDLQSIIRASIANIQR